MKHLLRVGMLVKIGESEVRISGFKNSQFGPIVLFDDGTELSGDAFYGALGL